MTAILTRSTRSPLAASAFALMFMLTAPVAPATAAQDPVALITNVGTQGIQALGQDVSSAARLAHLTQLFQEDFDIPGVGLFALGRYRSTPTQLEQQEFFRLYPDFTVRAFNARLNEYRGAPFRVTGRRSVGSETVVAAKSLLAPAAGCSSIGI
jgi:ABC-type transporter MlaC component